jgi:hypothetical protein
MIKAEENVERGSPRTRFTPPLKTASVAARHTGKSEHDAGAALGVLLGRVRRHLPSRRREHSSYGVC